MAELLQDVRYALRALRRSPGLAAAAILTLALGIGANSAIFSVVNGVLLKPLPYAQPERLVTVVSQFPTMGFDRFWISPPEYMELQERSRSYAAIGAYRTGAASVSTAGDPVRVTSAIATAELFQALGVPPLLGRTFGPDEDVPNGEPVVVLSHGLWQRAFGADPALVGQAIDVNGVRRTVLGIMPPGFDVADAGVEVWLPAALDRANRTNRGSHYLEVVARLAPGVTLEQARAEMRSLVARWGEEVGAGYHSPHPENHPLLIHELQEQLVGDARTALLLLLGAVGFVLLIACANVANLLLAKAEARQKEIAVRAALGAGRLRLLRQFLTESVTLAAIGGALGLAFGYAGLRLLLAGATGIPRADEIVLDVTVIAFTAAVSLATGLLFGLAPLQHLSHRALGLAIRQGGQRTTAAAGRLRRLLVVMEVALAVVLVVGSGLMLRSLAELQRVDVGFEPEGLVTFQLYLPPAGYPDAPAQVGFYERLARRVSALPGVQGFAAMSGLPPRRDLDANDMEFEGVPEVPGGPAHNIDYWQFVTADYFATMGIPIVDGRAFTASDDGAAGPVALINETAARLFWPGQNPIGRRLRPGFGDPEAPWFTIIGIVKDVKQGGIESETGTEVYWHYPQIAQVFGNVPRTMNVVVRTAAEPLALAPLLRQEVRAMDPGLPLADLRTMQENIGLALSRPRFIARLLTVFAALALTLAAVGTYGVMSYSVAERQRELGIRLAIGAAPGRLLRQVLREGLGLAAAGLALGVGGALLVTRLLASLLYGVSSTDPASFILAPLILTLVAAAACYLPARRATRVDPATVLRED